MAEEQDDPCLVVLDIGEDEEEESPELQSLLPSFGGLFEPNVTGIAGGIQESPGIEGLRRQATPAGQFAESVEPLLESIPGLAALSRAQRERLRGDILEGETSIFIPGSATDRILRDDVSMTPVSDTLMDVAGKSTWLLNNTTIHGNRTGRVTSLVSSKVLFDTKPHYHLYNLFSQMPGNRWPVNIINPPRQNQDRTSNALKEVHDPLRWASDKVWFNSVHVDGPRGYSSPLHARACHGKPSLSEFYYLNGSVPLNISDSVARYASGRNVEKASYNVWGTFYESPEKSSYFATRAAHHSPDSDHRTWEGYESSKNIMNIGNHLSYGITYESHTLLSSNVMTRPEDWKWVNYFYGYVAEEALQAIEESAENRQPDNTYMEMARDSSINQDSVYWWSSIYRNIQYISPKFKESLNLFPIIPFYNNRYHENSNVLPRPPYRIGIGPLDGRIARPPRLGREMFYDFNTNIPDLLTREESEAVDVGSKAYFDIRPVYSYFDCLYEKIFSRSLYELELPSPYIEDRTTLGEPPPIPNAGLFPPGLTDAAEQQRLQDFLFERLVAADSYFNLSGDMDFAPPVSNVGQRSIDVEAINDRSPAAIRDFARHMYDGGYYDFNLENTNDQIYLSLYSREELDSRYESRYRNPMFVEIELGHIEKSQMAEALTYDGDDSLVRSLFTSALISEVPSSSEESYSFVEQLIQTHTTANSGRAGFVDNLRGLNRNSEPEIPGLISPIRVSDTVPLQVGNSLDFAEWWSQTSDNITSAQQNASPVERFGNILRLMKIKIRSKRIIESSLRSYTQFMNGLPARSEVLGFIIEKYKVVENGTQFDHICNFHILSNNDREVEKFVDTQVRYGSIYEYRIHRVVIVYGNKYVYLDNQTEQQRVAKITQAYDIEGALRQNVFDLPFGIANMPCVKTFIVPTEKKRVSVVDHPPIFPNVEFIPYRNNSKSIIIAMTSNTGEFSAPPVFLEDDDRNQFLTVAISQGVPGVRDMEPDQLFSLDSQLEAPLTDEISTIKFKSDDPATNFEIFRLDEYPKKLIDFRNARKTKISKTSDSCVYHDDLMPDKKYYYVFRVEDIHGHVSNPTHIYEVILRTYDESVRMEVKIIQPSDLKEEKMRLTQSKISLRQFMKIRPNARQRSVSTVEDGTFSSFKSLPVNKMLGPRVVTSVWGQEFKLRVISKNTGKEIDIDFKFVPKLNVQENKKENLIC